jgi:hypothetical protein
VTFTPGTSHAEMRAAACWRWNEMGMTAELSGGAAAGAALLAGHYRPAPKSEFVRSCAAPEPMA